MAIFGTKPKDLLQLDYIDLGKAYTYAKYVLILRDDHSDYKLFFSCDNTTAETTATSIIDW